MTTKRKGRKPETVKVGNITVKVYRRDKKVTSHLKDGSTVVNFYQTFEVEDFTTGTRRLQSIADHGKAIRKAEDIARQLSTGQVEASSLTNAQAASFGRAMELLRPSGVSLEVAAATVAKGQELVGDRILEACRFFNRHGAANITPRKVAEVVTELVASKRAAKKSELYVMDLSRKLGRFAETFAVDIGNVTTPDVQRWIDGLKLPAVSSKNFRAVLHVLFAFAESRGYTFKGGNVVADTDRISTKGEGEIEIYSPGEISALLKHASEDFLPVVALGGFAGIRTAEIQRLEWNDIDLAGGFIHVGKAKSKTRSRRLIPVSSNLAQWLAPYAKRTGLVWKGDENHLGDARTETAEKAKTPWKHNALRHSFISYRLASTNDENKVASEAGNSPGMIYKHYRELVKPEAARQWFAIAPEKPANVITMSQEAAQV